MNEAVHPVVLYVPGLLPKPEPRTHADALLRCLRAGLQRVDPAVGDAIAATQGGFDMVSWTYDFYGEYRDFAIDADAVEAAIAQDAPSERDVAEADSWQRRVIRVLYLLGDLVPVLIPHLANERTEVHLRDLRRYVQDINGIAAHTRRMLKVPLRAAFEGGHPVLLIGHSMGSVIAYDALWELTHDAADRALVDLFLTMGSPLGQRHIQKRIKGYTASGAARYPHNIRHWKNLSAVGDLTSIDPRLTNDFADVLELGLVDSFEDLETYNWFRLDGELNVHSEYGYFVNDDTARTIADWWRAHDASIKPP
ncbi:MAG: alpha/beta fold hydrolase [Gammaproteobacteria bacterium]|nr:alpha/beta fold hydrolase [Gammaproteobacteria bacterium]